MEPSCISINYNEPRGIAVLMSKRQTKDDINGGIIEPAGLDMTMEVWMSYLVRSETTEP